MTTLTYNNVTDEQVQNLLKELQQSARVTGVSGSWNIDGSGIKATAQYSSGTLSVQILSKPFFVSESLIDSQIKQHLGVG